MKKENNIVLATRTTQDSYDDCISNLKKLVKDNNLIERIYIICNLRVKTFKIENIDCEVIFDTSPNRPTAFNLVINDLNEKLNKNNNSKYHLLTYSKEVDLRLNNIVEMVETLENNDKTLIVVGYRLKDNILKDKEFEIYANGNYKDNNIGIAYQVPWNTCALWNRKFIYDSGELKLNFDQICEKNTNQLSALYVKVNNTDEKTNYVGMEDGLAIAELVNKNSGLKYKLLNKDLNWNIFGDEKRILGHKIKMARKNIVLCTFMQLKGYSVEKLKKASIRD